MGTFGKHHALFLATRHIVYLLCELRFTAHKFEKLLFVTLPIGYNLACNSAFNSSFGNGGRDLHQQARVYRLWNEIVPAEREVPHLVHLVHNFGNRLLCKVGYSLYGCQLHLFVNGCCSHVECTAEYVGETNYVVYLVGVIAAAGAHKHIGAAIHCIFVCNFGFGVCKSEDNGVFGH